MWQSELVPLIVLLDLLETQGISRFELSKLHLRCAFSGTKFSQFSHWDNPLEGRTCVGRI